MPCREEGIRVGVVHGPGSRIAPRWFELARRRHDIRQITASWQERRGSGVLLHFHVTDDGALYELVYDPAGGSWRLELIEAL